MLVNVTIPVFNEETRLPQSLPKLHRFVAERCQFKFEVVIADNASTEQTLEVARSLSQAYDAVRVVHLEEKGRGRALKRVWAESKADILSYMDVDLSTELDAFPPLIEAVASRGFDLAIGSRLHRDAHTERGWRREFISRGYNRLVKALFATHFSDAQCGFKAITRAAARQLLPVIEDNGWFFDTELLVVAEKLGYRIFDLPVRWVDDPDSRVEIMRTAWEDIKGLRRVRRNLAAGGYGRMADHCKRITAEETPIRPTGS
jgi:glycosyltransferase involved in cell wall biosynthesis